MKLSELEQTLRAIGVSPVKSLGQNFLHDQNLARWIVEKAGIQQGDFVLEIGPGLGALTEFSLATGARVLAIEKDKRLADFLAARFTTPSIQVLHADAMNFDERELFAHGRVKFLGNLPYYISSQLLMKFIQYPSPISLAVLMLQKEMAQRICAAPGSGDYGALSLTVQLHYRVEYLRTVGASVFLPRPDVDSALIRLTPREPDELPGCDPATFGRLVRAGFSQRRKQLQKLLRADIPDWSGAAAACGFDFKARAEELSLTQWIALANIAAGLPGESAETNAAEEFAVVDDRDVVTGRATRADVHANNLLHRAVHILIFNAAGELFLQKRSRWKDRHPLAWDSSAAGHVDADEDYDGAASREVQEELGVTGQLVPVAKLPASERTGHEFIQVYRMEHEGPFALPPLEIEHGRFFPPGIVRRWIAARPEDFAPGFIECWNALGASGALPPHP